MAKTIFIADLHLDKSYPHAVSAFLRFLQRLESESVDALYILGDLFEYWLGDDCVDETSAEIARAIKQFSQFSPVYFIHGNRDFLLGEAFARECGMKILGECEEIELYGVKTLILHGDTLCTGDTEYMAFRKKVRSLRWQTRILKLPAWLRRLKAWQYRRRSKKANQQKSDEIMDVNQQSVVAIMRQHDAKQMIHGHTHRPNIHRFYIDGVRVSRMVVGDWYEQGSILTLTAKGAELRSFSLQEELL